MFRETTAHSCSIAHYVVVVVEAEKREVLDNRLGIKVWGRCHDIDVGDRTISITDIYQFPSIQTHGHGIRHQTTAFSKTASQLHLRIVL